MEVQRGSDFQDHPENKWKQLAENPDLITTPGPFPLAQATKFLPHRQLPIPRLSPC